ncbi:MAG: hypothetical protein P0119_12600 [Nitrospira sp.]|nr:hypothetical protein [Nitrospira sp.]
MRRAGILTGGVVALILLAVVCIPPPAEPIKLYMTSHRFTNPLITTSHNSTGPHHMGDPTQAFKGTIT